MLSNKQLEFLENSQMQNSLLIFQFSGTFRYLPEGGFSSFVASLIFLSQKVTQIAETHVTNCCHPSSFHSCALQKNVSTHEISHCISSRLFLMEVESRSTHYAKVQVVYFAPSVSFHQRYIVLVVVISSSLVCLLRIFDVHLSLATNFNLLTHWSFLYPLSFPTALHFFLISPSLSETKLPLRDCLPSSPVTLWR